MFSVVLQCGHREVLAFRMRCRWRFREMWLVRSQMIIAICFFGSGAVSLTKELDRESMLNFLADWNGGDCSHARFHCSLDRFLWARLRVGRLLGRGVGHCQVRVLRAQVQRRKR